MSLPEEIARHIEPEPNAGCWLWTGTLTGNGYGALKSRNAHRVIYEMLHGPLPQGTELDHTCKVRSCVNPSHVEVVTHRENTLRSDGPTALNAKRTHCPNGHPYDKVEKTNGARRCWQCQYARIRAWKEKKRGHRSEA